MSAGGKAYLMPCAALLQEMQLGAAVSTGGAAWDATCPAFWDKVAIEEDYGECTEDSSICQVLGAFTCYGQIVWFCTE